MFFVPEPSICRLGSPLASYALLFALMPPWDPVVSSSRCPRVRERLPHSIVRFPFEPNTGRPHANRRVRRREWRSAEVVCGNGLATSQRSAEVGVW
jgi:hypothetical protein